MMTAAALVWLSCAPSAHSPRGVVRAWSRRSASRQQQQQPEEEEEAWPQEEEGEHLGIDGGIDGLTEYLARYYGEEGEEGEEVGEEEAFTTEYEEDDQDADILFLPDLAREFTEDVRNPDLVNHLEFTRQVLHKSSHTHKSSQTSARGKGECQK